jgi:hypothetical protein
VLLLIGLLTGTATAQDDAPAPLEAAGPVTEAAPEAPPHPLAGLAEDAELLDLPLPDAIALLQTARVGPTRGTVVLVARDRRPHTDDGAVQAFRLLPDQGWQVVLTTPARLPALRSGQLFPPQAETGSGDGADAGADTPPPAGPAQAEARRATPASVEAWRDDGLQRLQALLDVLATRGIGPVWLLGEGPGADLVARLLADADAVPVLGAVFVDPRSPPPLRATWPGNPALPVLDVLDPRDGPARLAARRRLAAEAGAVAYRQRQLPTLGAPRFQQETVFARRLRGWLESRQRGA